MLRVLEVHLCSVQTVSQVVGTEIDGIFSLCYFVTQQRILLQSIVKG